jgi:hypothetical protein
LLLLGVPNYLLAKTPIILATRLDAFVTGLLARERGLPKLRVLFMIK